MYNGVTAGLALVFVGNGVRTLLMEWRCAFAFFLLLSFPKRQNARKANQLPPFRTARFHSLHRLDANAIRFALLACAPLLYCVSLFFALQIVQNVGMA